MRHQSTQCSKRRVTLLQDNKAEIVAFNACDNAQVCRRKDFTQCGHHRKHLTNLQTAKPPTRNESHLKLRSFWGCWGLRSFTTAL